VEGERQALVAAGQAGVHLAEVEQHERLDEDQLRRRRAPRRRRTAIVERHQARLLEVGATSAFSAQAIHSAPGNGSFISSVPRTSGWSVKRAAIASTPCAKYSCRPMPPGPARLAQKLSKARCMAGFWM